MTTTLILLFSLPCGWLINGHWFAIGFSSTTEEDNNKINVGRLHSATTQEENKLLEIFYLREKNEIKKPREGIGKKRDLEFWALSSSRSSRHFPSFFFSVYQIDTCAWTAYVCRHYVCASRQFLCVSCCTYSTRRVESGWSLSISLPFFPSLFSPSSLLIPPPLPDL